MQVGRLNAALNQSGTLDRSIDDVLEHFVYVPRQSPVNPQDIPFFLSTRLGDNTGPTNEDDNNQKKVKQGKTEEDDDKKNMEEEEELQLGDALKLLSKYETRAAQIAAEYEENMVRF